MFSGLAQTGAWGCFDEFNRINIEVLSVVAQQILSILSAQSVLNPDKTERRFVFEGNDIVLRWSAGIFITMNPGYAGRTELPDNLKSMFRPISMMVPDSGMIAEIILFGQGFSNTRVLAKKVAFDPSTTPRSALSTCFFFCVLGSHHVQAGGATTEQAGSLRLRSSRACLCAAQRRPQAPGHV
jgi:hypothetical protein